MLHRGNSPFVCLSVNCFSSNEVIEKSVREVTKEAFMKTPPFRWTIHRSKVKVHSDHSDARPSILAPRAKKGHMSEKKGDISGERAFSN
jgi:hypothetical protein